jgi:hypothetical protein
MYSERECVHVRMLWQGHLLLSNSFGINGKRDDINMCHFFFYLFNIASYNLLRIL